MSPYLMDKIAEQRQMDFARDAGRRDWLVLFRRKRG